MILAEVIGEDWPAFADSNKIELTKLEHADSDLLAEICRDDGWIVTFYGHFVKAVISEIIIPKFAFAGYAADHEWTQKVRGLYIPDEIGVSIIDIWYRDEALFATANIKIGPTSFARTLGCIVDQYLACRVREKVTSHNAADDISLTWELQSFGSSVGNFYYPIDKFPKDWLDELDASLKSKR